MTLDSFLNIAIPIGIVLFFAFLFYSKLQGPIHQLIRWIKSLFEYGVDNVPEQKSIISYDY